MPIVPQEIGAPKRARCCCARTRLGTRVAAVIRVDPHLPHDSIEGNRTMQTSTSVPDTSFKSSSRWLAFIARALLPAGLFALALLGVVATSSKAQANGDANVNARGKLARDLQAGIAVADTPTVNWARDIKGARY